jgi:hypothetical protein
MRDEPAETVTEFTLLNLGFEFGLDFGIRLVPGFPDGRRNERRITHGDVDWNWT